MEEIIIRSYRRQDRSQVREIAWNTAMIGEPADVFFDGKEIFADFLTAYFTDYEPESCFIAERNGRVAGYLLGARDTAVLAGVFKNKILVPLLLRAVTKGIFLRKKNIAFLFSCLTGILRGEFKMPDFSREYPATLHINLKKECRNLGAGSKLISAFLDHLLKSRVSGVYLATLSEKAAVFFEKQGFSLLYKGRRSYFRQILQKDISIYVYGKKLR